MSKALSDEKTYKKRSLWLEAWRRMKRNKVAVLSLCVLAVFLLIAIFADVLFDYKSVVTKPNIANRLMAPNSKHLFGTDELGRDILARIAHGMRISLSVGIISQIIGISAGIILGATAGYYGGKLDNFIMRCTDVFLALPPILMCLAIVSALGTSFVNLIIAVSISNIPFMARLVRGQFLTVKNLEFIEAAKCMGASDMTIIYKHILPNTLSPIIVQAALGVGGTIMAISGLSFIGLGMQPPSPEWGAMLSTGKEYIREAWHVTVIPGIMIMITVVFLNLLGDGLRDAIDPKMKE
ncbi:ABC transporter permease [Clostridiaceae bacterium M8S5]|nr:ABC transporter permease [Clostridiaceae bacterium M8S5]